MPVLAAQSGTARASILGISSTRRALSVVVVTARVTMDDSRVPSRPLILVNVKSAHGIVQAAPIQRLLRKLLRTLAPNGQRHQVSYRDLHHIRKSAGGSGLWYRQFYGNNFWHCLALEN